MSNLLYNEGKSQEYILGRKHAVHPTVPAGYMSIRQRCFLCKARTFIVRLNATARLVKYAHSVRIASTNSNVNVSVSVNASLNANTCSITSTFA